jgi:hypothetical protein
MANTYQLHDFWDPMLLQDFIGPQHDQTNVSTQAKLFYLQSLMKRVAFLEQWVCLVGRHYGSVLPG